MALLDSPLGVTPVAAHVPLAAGASDARFRIGPTHDADNEIARNEAASFRCGLHRAQRFVPKNKALLTGRRKAVTTVQNFAIGPAHPERPRAHQNEALRPGLPRASPSRRCRAKR